MTPKTILLVSSAFYPEISPRSFRATELAKEFSRKGHKVFVLTKYRDYDYSEFLKEFPLTLKIWRRSLSPVIPEVTAKPFSSVRRALKRVLSLLFEFPDIEETFRVRKILIGVTGYDLVISFAVPFPVHWGVAWARSERNPIGKIWVADCGDPYMFARLDSFKKPFYFKFLEVYFCRKCDFLSVPFSEMQNQFYPEFRTKIRVIPQGFNIKEIVLCNTKPVNEKPVFIFTGSIIPGKRDLSLFLNFISSLSLDYLFIVYTVQKSWFNQYRTAMGERLELNDYIDRLSLIYEMSKADFLVNVDTALDNQFNVEAVPSKLIDYALTGRPILNINSAKLDKELVLEFLNKNYSRQRFVDVDRYDIRTVSEKFLNCID